MYVYHGHYPVVTDVTTRKFSSRSYSYTIHYNALRSLLSWSVVCCGGYFFFYSCRRKKIFIPLDTGGCGCVRWNPFVAVAGAGAAATFAFGLVALRRKCTYKPYGKLPLRLCFECCGHESCYFLMFLNDKHLYHLFPLLTVEGVWMDDLTKVTSSADLTKVVSSSWRIERTRIFIFIFVSRSLM